MHPGCAVTWLTTCLKLPYRHACGELYQCTHITVYVMYVHIVGVIAN